jgi:hypothetical protein
MIYVLIRLSSESLCGLEFSFNGAKRDVHTERGRDLTEVRKVVVVEVHPPCCCGIIQWLKLKVQQRIPICILV